MKRLSSTWIILLLLGALIPKPIELRGQLDTSLTNPSACGLGIVLTDNNCPQNGATFNPDRFRIPVGNAPGSILGGDVFLAEVRLIISHDWIGDLDLALISPGGQRVRLSADNGGTANNYGDPSVAGCQEPARFTAASCASIEMGAPPYTDQPYLPEESLFEFNDGQTDPNGIWTLEVCDDLPEDVGLLEYVELVFEPLSCLPVREPQVLGVDTTTVTLGWTPSETCDVYLEYGPPGFTPGQNAAAGQGTVVSADCPPFPLAGLAPDTEYELVVRGFCESSGSFSANSCPITFRTGCLPPPPTIRTTFEADTVCTQLCDAACAISGTWQNSTTDQRDWLVNEGETPTQGTGPASGVGGAGRYLYMEASESSNCQAGDTAALVSNCIRLDKRNTDTCHLSFNYHMQGSQIGRLVFQVSTDGGISWQSIWERAGDQGLGWRKVYLSLAAFSDGARLRFRLLGIKGSGSKGDIALDEIVFYGSEDLGPPTQVFYADQDGDGFGSPERLLRSCLPGLPDGFVTNAADCDDDDPAINPDAEESPCNGVDENCQPQDDLVLPPPLAINDTVCSGELANFCVEPQSDQLIIWYRSAEGDDLLGSFGNCHSEILPENNSPAPVSYTYYAEETNFECRSATRTPVTVVVNPRPRIGTTDEPLICPADSFDLASLNIVDENLTGGALSFHDAFPVSAANRLDNTIVSPTASRNYYFRVASPQGCTDVDSVRLGINPGPELTFTPGKTVGLCEAANGVLRVEASGGVTPFRYLWSTGSETDSITLLAEDLPEDGAFFALTVTDAEGCFSVDSAFVSPDGSIDAVQRQVTNVSSCSGADGRIELTPLSGQAPFSFEWESRNGVSGDTSGIANTLVIDSLRQGAYRITVTDNSSQQCAFLMRSVLVNGPGAIVNGAEVESVSCPGAADGRICVDLEAGNPEFLWSTGDTTRCIDQLSGGTYSLTVTEGDCQTILTDLRVREPDTLKVIPTFTMPACATGADGRIRVEAFGGSPGYQYRWSTGSRDPLIDGVGAGVYQLTLTDSRGCQKVESFTLGAPPSLSILVDSLSGISCAGEQDAFVQVRAGGGVGPYRYRWSTGTNAPVLANLGAGQYDITVEDLNGCSVSRSFTFEAPDPLAVEEVQRVAPDCEGDTTGLLAVAAVGGRPPYTYAWADGARDSLRSRLGVGAYQVVVRDASGCVSDTLRLSLDPLSRLTVSTMIEEPSCVGRADGRITVQPDGPAPFRYRWARGDTTQTLAGVGMGSYALTVTDGQGCRYDSTLVVMARQAFESVQLTPQNPFCAGDANGAILTQIVQTTATPPFNYEWSTGATTKDLIDLPEGTYALTITDQEGCRFASDTLALQEPQPLAHKVIGLGDIKCQGDSSSFIEIATFGGTPPYTYNWLGRQEKSSAIFDIPSGDYPLQIVDAKGCVLDVNVAVSEPPPLEVGINLIQNDQCDGSSDNQLAGNVSGGVPPYQYRWSNGSTAPVQTNLPAGGYQLSVTDDNGCTKVSPPVKVRGSEGRLRLEGFSVESIRCFGEDNGALEARVSGGSSQYIFHFSNNQIIRTSESSVRLNGIAQPGDYDVTVTDAVTGCVVSSQKRRLEEPGELNLQIEDVRNINCYGEQSGAILTGVIGGKAPFNYTWYDSTGVEIASSADLTGVGPGVYRAEVIDANGCRDSIPFRRLVNLNAPLELRRAETEIQEVACRGEASGRIAVQAQGGAPPYTYLWSSGASGPEIGGLEAGVYRLTLTDSRGCRTEAFGFEISQPDSALLITGNTRPASCAGVADGRIAVKVYGGVSPYQMVWRRDGSVFARDRDTLEDLPARQYRLSVIDARQCQRNQNFTVSEPETLQIMLTLDPPRDSEEKRGLEGVVSGGTPPYQYAWSTGDTTARLDSVAFTTYSLTVTDAQGCRQSDSLVVTKVFEPSKVLGLRLFPNPTSGVLNVRARFGEALSGALIVRDLLGRPVLRRDIPRSRRMEEQLGLHALPAGTYQLSLVREGRRLFVERFVIVE